MSTAQRDIRAGTSEKKVFLPAYLEGIQFSVQVGAERSKEQTAGSLGKYFINT